MIKPGDTVTVLPAYMMDTKARTGIDELTGSLVQVLAVPTYADHGDAYVMTANGREWWVNIGRLVLS
jgi:hypothetical protein